jgi:hypothetical protein
MVLTGEWRAYYMNGDSMQGFSFLFFFLKQRKEAKESSRL